MNLKNIAGLEALQAGDEKSQTAIIMLHGYGANMHDLFALWEMWDQNDLCWYFPNAPFSLPMGNYEGRAWFSIDVAALERAMQEGKHRDLSGSIPIEFDDTIKLLEQFIRSLAQTHNKIIIGGFSQGAMCASHLGMVQDLSLAGLILLSGNLIAESKIPHNAKGIPFYQSHGSLDPILSIEGARLLEGKLKSLNFQGHLSVFRGGHEIPMSVINEVRLFIGNLI
jgi:phospholipase/carboxylesterase